MIYFNVAQYFAAASFKMIPIVAFYSDRIKDAYSIIEGKFYNIIFICMGFDILTYGNI